MKVLTEKYPKGSLKYQKTDGRYIDNYLYENLRIMAKKIPDDMTFLGIIYSSTLEVGTGKSVLATQIGEIWTDLIKEEHGIEIPFNSKNVVWRAKELIERSFEVPKYSCLLLDEWEDAHYWSELGMTLRQFFRKCRQLNLFILVIIPNYFQFPMAYAIGRSIFAIDVHFGDGFDRGYFKFYGFNSKRQLYLSGKKYHNYKAANPDFDGRFFDGYGIDREEYLEAKAEDIRKWDEDDKKPLTREDMRAEVIGECFKVLKERKNVTQEDFAIAFNLDRTTISNYINGKTRSKVGPVSK